MGETFPTSPFSTRFSGREGETRLRIQNIAQGQRRRPGPLVLLVALAAILSCGGLISCQVKAERPVLSQLLTDEILTDDILNGTSILAGGDLDGDGKIGLSDALQLVRSIATGKLDATVTDVLALLRYIVVGSN